MSFYYSFVAIVNTFFGIALTVVSAAQGVDSSVVWQPTYEEDFSDDSWRDAWKLDGSAELSTEKEGETDFLGIKTLHSEVNTRDRCSTLWLQRPFEGDLLIKFRARAEPRSRALLYFNANPTERSGYESLFDWERPDAKMFRYAGTGLMELYSVGILRNDQRVCNFRYLGGPEMSKFFVAQQPLFTKISAIASYDSPFADKPANTWFEFALEIRNNHLAFDVDGHRVIDHVDTGMVESADCQWKPLTKGGCIALRNFNATKVCFDYINVYQAKEKE